jgi:hypothetical protein
VPLLDNPLTTSDKTVKLALSLPQNATLATPFSAVLTIQNTTTHYIYIPMLLDGLNR